MRKMIVPLTLLACSLFAKPNNCHEKVQGLIHQGDNWWRWSNEREAERCYTKVINETDCPRILEMATLRRGLLYAELGENALAVADFSKSFHSSQFNIFTDLMNDPNYNHEAENSITDGLRNSLPTMKPLIFSTAISYHNRSLKHPSNEEVGGAWDFLYDGDSLANFHEIPERISQCIEEIEKECLRFFERAREALLKGEVNAAANYIQEAIRKKFLSTETLVHQKTIEKKFQPEPSVKKPTPPKPAPRPLPVAQPKPAPMPRPAPVVHRPAPRPAPVALPAPTPPKQEPVAVATASETKTLPAKGRRGRRGRVKRNIRVGATKENEQNVPAKVRPVRGRRGRRGRVAVAQNNEQTAPAKVHPVRGRRGRKNVRAQAAQEQPVAKQTPQRRGRRRRR